MPVKKYIILSLVLVFMFSWTQLVYPASCYGTKMPQKNKFFIGLESDFLFNRYLENSQGKLRSKQQFLDVSYGVFDWLALDLKGGAGDIRQHPQSSDEVNYSYGFAGGYGFRLRFLDRKNWKMVFGFQHISVHPKRAFVAGVKNKAILDDWQTSLLVSYDFKRIVPYLGTRWSRVDYIHWVDDVRSRVMSDMTRDIGLIWGIDLPITEKIWLNIEGSAFDSDALACSIKYAF